MKNVEGKMFFGVLLYVANLWCEVNSAGFMTIQFEKYNNHDSRCQDGTFCDTILIFNARESACDPTFRLTADKNTPGGTNLFDYQQPNYYDNQDVINFGSMFGTISNPVIIAMNFDDNPGSLQITVTVWDKDTTKNDLIDVFAASLTANGPDRKSLTMSSQPMGHTLSVNYWYSCHTNYYGGTCNTYCLGQNDAAKGYYTCDSNGQKVCKSGWIRPSTNCKTPHPCATGVCKNGGTCTAQEESYLCTCPTDYTGTDCQQFLNPCQYRNPCKNSAPCYLDAANQPKCRCPAQFTGSQCDQDVNECSAPTNPCSNFMLCINTYGGFNCNCTDTRFAGALCEISVCNGTVCHNNGTCIPSVDRLPRCACLAGFTGANCEIDVDDCASSLCRNGATCRDLVNNFACDCPLGFVGALCERNPNDCVGSPCLNGGNCTDGLANFTCICPLGFVGLRCEQNLDDCVALPCQNGGTCIDGVASFNCTCRPGFSGAICQHPPAALNATAELLIGGIPTQGASSETRVNVIAVAVPCLIVFLLLVGLAVFLGIYYGRRLPKNGGSEIVSNEIYDNGTGQKGNSAESLARMPEDAEYCNIGDLGLSNENYSNPAGQVNSAYEIEA